MTFFVFNLAFGQTIKKDGEEVKPNPDTKKNVSMLVDSLTGTWKLIRTIRYENGDTIIQEPSTQLWFTSGAKPSTKIVLDSLRNFELEQACMKCPYLHWIGRFELETRTYNGLEFFYLSFIDDRVKETKKKKRKNASVLEFNGYLTDLGNGEMTLMDKEGREWIYKLEEEE